MAFLAPLIAPALGSILGGGVASVAAGLGAAALLKKKKAVAPAAPEQRVTPLPDEGSPGVRYRMERARRSIRSRRGYQSTLITGQLGDTRAPATNAPLLLGG